MVTAITSLRNLPELFRLFTGTLEQAIKQYPDRRIFHYTGKYSTRSGAWNIIAIEQETPDEILDPIC
jgi:hypothetical protein